MSGVEGAGCEDYDDGEAGVGGYRLPASAWFDTRPCVCRIKSVGLPDSAAWWQSLQCKSTCHRGGIGRRAWFRSMYRQRCGGSSPFDGTKKLVS